MSISFRGTVVWITGASSGIGEELAKNLCAQGARVILSARRTQELERVVALCDNSGETLVLPLNVTDELSVNKAVDIVLRHFGKVDVLLNNAGMTQRARVVDTENSVFRKIMDVNYFGPLMLTKAILPHMLKKGEGHIVCVTSVAAKYGSPMRSGYCGAKHAVHGLFDSLREELRNTNISVSLILPGAVNTNISLNALRGDGSVYGKVDAFLAKGMSAEVCAARILKAIALRRKEVVIARGAAYRSVWLKRFFPSLLSWTMRPR